MSTSANVNPDGEAAAADAPGTEESRSATSGQPVGGAGEAKHDAALLAELLEAGGEVALARAPAPGILGTRVGRFVEWSPGSAPIVEFPGNTLGPLAARSVVPLELELVRAAIADRRGVMLSFEDGKPEAPIITGLLQPVDLARVEADDEDEDEDVGDEPESESESVELRAGPGDALEARVDGRRVELEAADEIVLRCGKASIVLRRNGRVVIRGTYVETRSRGVNRIKGGSVEIN